MLGAICGLDREARCVIARADLHVRIAGMVKGRAQALARELIGQGVQGLVSFGLAGALDPAMRPGTPFLPSRVIRRDGRSFGVDAAWRARALLHILDARDGALLGSDGAIATAAGKARAFAETGAAAVDMESHEIAAAAEEARLPFLVVRAIADGAGTALPGAALAAVGPDGRERPLAVLYALLKRPGELPLLLRVARDSAKGIETLRRVGRTGALTLLV